jgi:hypothetical protein
MPVLAGRWLPAGSVRPRHRLWPMKVGPTIFSRLIALRGIGPNVANILQAEILGRRFANRREIAQYARFRCVRWPQASSGPFSSDQAARPKAWWTKARCAGMSSLGTTRTCPLASIDMASTPASARLAVRKLSKPSIGPVLSTAR